MPDNIAVPIQNEGENPFELDKENEDSSSSPEVTTDEPVKETTVEDPAPEGIDNTQEDSDKDIPFHKHPRWKEREDDWTGRFNEQETRHQDDLKSIREEFSKSHKGDAEDTEIPDWFGSEDKDMWKSFDKYLNERVKDSEKRAMENIKNEKESETKATQEATDYMKSEISSIEKDENLNPDELKVDQNKLLKIVFDNKLVDTDGKWNYKAAWKILKNEVPKADTTNKDRKAIASALGSDSKAEKKAVPYKTNEDFEHDKLW